jgi:aryl-alcohol dehydrogenase-like predicted oxidoreductase
MERRALGRTGQRSTVLTLGGAIFIGKPNEEQADRFIKLALDRGVNHIDVAPTYGDAELGLGKWVKEYRKNIFLACKTRYRTKKEAGEELKRSLQRLQTDYFDLYQLHGLDKAEELETALGPEGVIETILEAKRQALVKNIGITSHNPVNILNALKRFDFDTVLLPVNCVLAANKQPENDYTPVLKLARERNIGVIAMKAIAKGPWPDEKKPYNTWYQPFETQKEIDEALWFTLSQDMTTAATSSDIRLATMMIDAAERFEPMREEQQRALVSRFVLQKPLFPRQ